MLITAGLPAQTGSFPDSVAFGPDDASGARLLATVNSGDSTLTVFRVTAAGAMTRVTSLEKPLSVPKSVAFSPDGTLLATANHGLIDSVSLYRVTPAGALESLDEKAAGKGPISLAFDPGGTRLAVASNNNLGSVSMFDVSEGTLEAIQTLAATVPFSVAFNFDGTLLATASVHPGASPDAGVSTYFVSPEGRMTHRDFTSVSGRVPYAVAFSPKENLLASANRSGSVSLFRVSAAGALQDAGFKPAGKTPYSVAFSANGRLIATANEGGNSVSMFSLSAAGTLSSIGESKTGSRPRSVAFSRSGGLLATANANDSSVSLFAVSERGVLSPPIGSPTSVGPVPPANFPVFVAFSGSTRRLLATANDGSDSISVFSASTTGVLTPTPSFAVPVGPPGPNHYGPASVAFSADETLLASANVDADSVSVFQVSADGGLTPASPLITRLSSPESVSFSPKQRPGAPLLATASGNANAVRVFSVSGDGVLTAVGSSPPGRPAGPVSVTFSPNGELLATADRNTDSVSVFSVGSDGALSLVRSARVGPVMPGHRYAPVWVAFSPGGDKLVTANADDSSLSVFAVSGEGHPTLLARTAAELNPVSVAFSPAGVLATANALTDSLSLYSVASATGALTPIGAPTLTGPIPSSVAFSHDGLLLATANRMSNTVSVYPLVAPALDTSITSEPAAVTNATTATFKFESSYPATFVCRLDAEPAFTPCPSGKSYTGLGAGSHTFEVRGVDLLGMRVDTPPVSLAISRWTIDVTPPSDARLDQPLDGAANLSASPMFTWSPSTDGTADRYELFIDDASSARVAQALCMMGCSAPPSANLSHGRHTWRVDAVDGVGNVNPGDPRSFTVDAQAPAAFNLKAPQDGAATTERRPALSWETAVDAGVGLAGYDVKIDGVVVAGLDASATTFTPAELAEGVHSWQVVARDGHGNRQESAIQQFSIDLTAPVARLTAAPNPTLVGRLVTFDAGGSSDPGSGIARHEWDLDGDGTFERDTGATASTTQTYPERGTFGVQLRVTDRVGLIAESPVVHLRVNNGLDPGEQLGVTINDGALYTNNPKVTINATPPTFATQMLISNDGGFKNAQTFPLRAETSWTLESSGPERSTRIVYVRFVRGLAMSQYFDNIILDEIPPTVNSAQVTPAKSGGAPLLRVKASDRGGSKVAAVQVTNDRKRPNAKFRAQRATIKLKKARGERRLKLNRTVYVRVRDGAGNLSRWRTAKLTRAGRRG